MLILALHIPDGFLTPSVSAVGWLLAVILLGLALRLTRRALGERQVPLLGVLAAFVFAAQAINFPVAGGTSGHLLGGALAAIVVGPWAAALVMATVIALQGLLFQDGGLLVMGWNILNMGIFTAFSGYATYRLLARLPLPPAVARTWGAGLGAWLSVEVGAVATALELAASGSAPLPLALPAMAGVHAVIGIGEAAVTASAVALLARARPGLLAEGSEAAGGSAAVLACGLVAALLLAACAPLGSTLPDGLEHVSRVLGFERLAQGGPHGAVPLVTSPAVGVVFATAGGVLALFVTWTLVGRALRRR